MENSSTFIKQLLTEANKHKVSREFLEHVNKNEFSKTFLIIGTFALAALLIYNAGKAFGSFISNFF